MKPRAEASRGKEAGAGCAMTGEASRGGQARTKGAIKGGGEAGYIFDLMKLASEKRVDAGGNYSTAIGGLVEGERMQCGLMQKARGTGARPHSHPNEQWNYVIKGRLRVNIEGQPEQIVGPGTLIYFPANIVHSTVALPDEDVLFFVVKDMSYGIVGKPVDEAAGKYYEPGFEPDSQKS